MRKTKKNWYLLAYDIREPKRLQRTYYYVKKIGVSLQRSVFLIQTDMKGLDRIRKNITQRVDNRQDDVRLYPIRHPGVIWSGGQQTDKISNLFAPFPKEANKSFTGKIRQLFSRKKK